MAELMAGGAAAEGAATVGFIVTILQITGIIAAVLGVQVALRIYAEETEYRVEPLLAGALERRVYFASNLVVALASTGAGMVLAGVTMGIVGGTDDVRPGDMAWQAVATIPAVWLLVGLGFAAVGAAPQARLIAWVGIVASFGLSLLGPTFDLPDWALGISPFRHVPVVAAAAPEWSGLGWLGLIAFGLMVVGFIGFRRRDVV